MVLPILVQNIPKHLSESNTIVEGEIANSLKEKEKYYYLNKHNN